MSNFVKLEMMKDGSLPKTALQALPPSNLLTGSMFNAELMRPE